MIHFFPSRTVLLEIFGFPVHWYGILYLLSFLLALLFLPLLQRFRALSLVRDDWMEVVTWAVAGVLAGGRLGFVLFYEPGYFLANPLKIFAVWEGGMASHGGFLGVIIALVLLARYRKHDLWKMADVVSIPAAFGLGLGRIGNFINQELYGTVTALPWGIRIPGVEGLRHPIAIYAFILDALIGVICLAALLKARPPQSGRIFALFLMLYGIVRFSLEYLRDQQYGGFLFFTRGQALTVPLFIAGVVLWVLLGSNPRETIRKA